MGGIIILREYFEQILKNYLSAKNENFVDHPLARLIRIETPKYIKEILGEKNYIVKGSPGMGNWSQLPWVAIFNPDVTTSAQSGYYIVYLFKENMQGVYLSLNQGVTEFQEKYGDNEAIKRLFDSSEKFREKINNKTTVSNELLKSISLGSGNYAPFYEAGNIYSKYYPVNNLPSENVLISDLNEFLGLYNSISENISLTIIEDEFEISNKQKAFEN